MRGDFELRYTGKCKDASPAQIPKLILLSARRLPVTLGRQAGKGVVVVTGPDEWSGSTPKVSRKHVVIGRRRPDGILAVIDRGSTNGTYINGTRVTQGEEHPLRYNDTLAVAGTDGVLQWKLLRAEPKTRRTTARENETAIANDFARDPVPPTQRNAKPSVSLAGHLSLGRSRFTLARAPLVGETRSRPAWQTQVSVLKVVSKSTIIEPNENAAAADVDVVAVANARQQLSGAAGVVIEGMTLPEYNSVYLPAEDLEGWPHFHSFAGKHLYRSISKRAWVIRDSFEPDAEGAKSYVSTVDGLLLDGEHHWKCFDVATSSWRDKPLAVTVLHTEQDLHDHQKRLSHMRENEHQQLQWRQQRQQQRHKNQFHKDPTDESGVRRPLFDPDAALSPRQRRLLGVDIDVNAHKKSLGHGRTVVHLTNAIQASFRRFDRINADSTSVDNIAQAGLVLSCGVKAKPTGPKVKHIGRPLDGEICGLIAEVSKMQETDVRQGSWSSAWSGMLYKHVDIADAQAAAAAATATVNAGNGDYGNGSRSDNRKSKVCAPGSRDDCRQYFCVLTAEAMILREASSLCGRRRGCVCKTQRIDVCEMAVVRTAHDETETSINFPLDCTFIIKDSGKFTHVFAADSVSERRAWLQCLTELRISELIKNEQCGVSAQWLLNFIRGDKSQRMLDALRAITSADVRIIQGPFKVPDPKAKGKGKLAEQFKHSHDFRPGSWVTQVQLCSGRYVWANTPASHDPPTAQDLIDKWLLPGDNDANGPEQSQERLNSYIDSVRCLWDCVVDPTLFGVSTEPQLRQEHNPARTDTALSSSAAGAGCSASQNSYIPAESHVLSKSQSERCCSYVEHILRTNPKAAQERGTLGQPNLFISYSQSTSVQSLASAIEEHCSAFDLEPRDVFVWIDALSMRWHAATNDCDEHTQRRQTTKKLIQECGHVLAVLSNWDQPESEDSWRKRIWCVYEGFECYTQRARFSVGLAQAEREQFQNALIEDPARVTDLICGNVDVEHAKSFDHQGQKAMLIDHIAKMDSTDPQKGFLTVNLAVAEQLRNWLFERALRFLADVQKKVAGQRTEHDCRLLLSYCSIMMEFGRSEAQTVCTAGINIASGLVTHLNQAGQATGHFEDAAVLELLRELTIANTDRKSSAASQEQDGAQAHAREQQASDGLQVLQATGRTVCEAHYPNIHAMVGLSNNDRTQIPMVSDSYAFFNEADEHKMIKSADTMKAVVVGRVLLPFDGTSSSSKMSDGIIVDKLRSTQSSTASALTRLRVVYETGQIATVDMNWVRGDQWKNDPVLQQDRAGECRGHGVVGSNHEITLRFMQRLTVPSEKQSAGSVASGATGMTVKDKIHVMRNLVSAWLHFYPEHPRTLEALGRLARVLAGDAVAGTWDDSLDHKMRKDPALLQEAESIFEALLPRMDVQLGVKHRVTIGALSDYGAVLIQTIDISEMLHDLQAVDDQQCRETRYRMTEAQKLAWLEQQTSQNRPVFQVHRDALQCCTELYGPQHLLTLRATYQLACVHLKFLREQTARNMLNKVLETASVVLGMQHPLSVDIEVAIARCDVVRLFNELDADGSGELGVEEVRALGRWRAPGAPDLTELELEVAMAEMDPSGDNLVDAVEFSAWWARQLAGGGGLLGEACANAGAMVGAVLLEREGPRTASEKLQAALAASRARVEAKKKAAGDNLSVKLTRQRLEKQARRLFAAVDEDNSGLLDVDEVRILAKKLGLEMGPEEAQQAVAAMDTDTSGEVDFSEFFEWFARTVMDVAREDAKNANDASSRENVRSSGRTIDDLEAASAPAEDHVDTALAGEGTSVEASRWTDGQNTWRVMSVLHHEIEVWDAMRKCWMRHESPAPS